MVIAIVNGSRRPRVKGRHMHMGPVGTQSPRAVRVYMGPVGTQSPRAVRVQVPHHLLHMRMRRVRRPVGSRILCRPRIQVHHHPVQHRGLGKLHDHNLQVSIPTAYYGFEAHTASWNNICLRSTATRVTHEHMSTHCSITCTRFAWCREPVLRDLSPVTA